MSEAQICGVVTGKELQSCGAHAQIFDLEETCFVLNQASHWSEPLMPMFFSFF